MDRWARKTLVEARRRLVDALSLEGVILVDDRVERSPNWYDHPVEERPHRLTLVFEGHFDDVVAVREAIDGFLEDRYEWRTR